MVDERTEAEPTDAAASDGATGMTEMPDDGAGLPGAEPSIVHHSKCAWTELSASWRVARSVGVTVDTTNRSAPVTHDAEPSVVRLAGLSGIVL